MPSSITPIQDTIQFAISAEETVTNDTVKVVASIVALVTHDMTEQKLKDSIRQLTQRFIKAEWNFSNMTRSNHAAGLEQVTLTATARVPESENYGLDRRRVEASIEGMTIASHTTDTSPTTAQIEQAQSKLRLTILTKAETERQAISNALTVPYRLGSVTFNEGYGNTANIPRGGMAMAASAAYGSGFGADGGDEDAIGNAVKLVMQASVQLRISR